MLSRTPDRAARSFIFPSLFWLLLGSVTLSVSQLQLVSPDLVALEALTYPRLRAVTSICLQFGWLTLAGMAAIYYVLPRVTGTRMKAESAGVVAGLIVNFSVVLAVLVTIFSGPQGLPFSELPVYLVPGFVLAGLLVALSTFLTIASRAETEIYVSAKYFAGAAIWLPLGLGLGHLHGLRGAAAGLAHLHAVNDVLVLWISATGLGALHYVLPRASGEPLYSSRLADIGFWTLAAAGSMSAAGRGVFGPFPVWLQTVGIASGALLLAATTAVVVNAFGTLSRGWGRAPEHPSIRFFAGGTVIWAVAILQGSVQGLRSVSRGVGLTEAGEVQVWLILLAASMWAAGLFTFALPRMLGKAWVGSSRISSHFWLAVAGTAGFALAGWAAGIAFAAAMHAGAASGSPVSSGEGFMATSAAVSTLRFAGFAATLLLLAAHGLFVQNVFRAGTIGDPRPVEIVVPVKTR